MKCSVSNSTNTDTCQTTSAVTSFCHAMAKYPNIQKRAQDDIDRAVGNERLPLLQDRQQLPFVDAIMSEVLRWKPAVPLGALRVFFGALSDN